MTCPTRVVKAARAILVLAAAGISLTITVSWAIATWIPHHKPLSVMPSPIDEWLVRPPLFSGYANQAPTGQLTTTSFGRLDRTQVLIADESSKNLWAVIVVDAGYPLKAMRSWRAMKSPEGQTFNRGWRNPIRASPRPLEAGFRAAAPSRDLPNVPLWPGFALDTLFYAAIAWSLWQLPLILLSRRRAAANHCPRCNYDLRGLAPSACCPECGAPRASSPEPPPLSSPP